MTPVELHDRARAALGARPVEGALDDVLAYHLQQQRVSQAVHCAAAGRWAESARLLSEAADLGPAGARVDALRALAREALAEADAASRPEPRSRAA